ncbi:permease [Alkaliphilus peptidifermentans]|uniref:Permease n=1 Tax=Alkaliphilus peptidifermentans DSM 18978 TaxID=1120976 RepID=A0A1G5FYV0_9FIRM|nr:permease [Alkaliphilus peptidifermentans]SCY44384.1 hypothetical protein SAMN03080606_01545 [Alkaliphilus peptidifermentans DSM 18978]
MTIINQKKAKKLNWLQPTLIIGVVGLVFLLVINSFNEGFVIDRNVMESFTTIFISIILEAIPFVMLGVFISSIIQIFVSEEMIAKIIPKNKFVGIFAASLMGIIFPVCECANVPITRRLIKKGVPLHIGITFLMSVAIMNPVVLLSTYYAFSGSMQIVILRGLLGMIGAMIIGFVVSLLYKDDNQLRELSIGEEITCGCGHEHEEEHHHSHQEACGCSGQKEIDIHFHLECGCGDEHEEDLQFLDLACGCGHDHGHHQTKDISMKAKVVGKVKEIIEHTSAELYAVGRFLILGAFLSSIVQTMVARSFLITIGQGQIISIVVMMILAFVLSLCSEADAFIARTFVGQFTSGSIVAFMIFGPMIDVKNTLMLLEGFKAKFVIKLIIITSIICFGFALIINLIGL